MKTIGKALIGAAVGVGAVTVAPVVAGTATLGMVGIGGASLVAGGIEAIATAASAGAAGAVLGDAFIDDKSIKQAAKKTSRLIGKGTKSVSATLSNITGKKLFPEEKMVSDSLINLTHEEQKSIALIALSYYIARCDGHISEEEKNEINKQKYEILNIVSEECKNIIASISRDEMLTFKTVCVYLDLLSSDEVESFNEVANQIAKASDGILPEEEEVLKQLNSYINLRREMEKLVE